MTITNQLHYQVNYQSNNRINDRSTEMINNRINDNNQINNRTNEMINNNNRTNEMINNNNRTNEMINNNVIDDNQMDVIEEDIINDEKNNEERNNQLIDNFDKEKQELDDYYSNLYEETREDFNKEKRNDNYQDDNNDGYEQDEHGKYFTILNEYGFNERIRVYSTCPNTFDNTEDIEYYQKQDEQNKKREDIEYYQNQHTENINRLNDLHQDLIQLRNRYTQDDYDTDTYIENLRQNLTSKDINYYKNQNILIMEKIIDLHQDLVHEQNYYTELDYKINDYTTKELHNNDDYDQDMYNQNMYNQDYQDYYEPKTYNNASYTYKSNETLVSTLPTVYIDVQTKNSNYYKFSIKCVEQNYQITHTAQIDNIEYKHMMEMTKIYYVKLLLDKYISDIESESIHINFNDTYSMSYFSDTVGALKNVDQCIELISNIVYR